MSDMHKLALKAANPLIDTFESFDFGSLEISDRLQKELKELYCLRNGFYAFEMALHVFPISNKEDSLTFQNWNSDYLWKHLYPEMPNNIYFFSEDIFGMQFCFKRKEIFLFDGETFGFTKIADSLNEWAKKILTDTNYLTGHLLGHAWQEKYGELKQGHRLSPIIPFTLGGKFEVENLKAVSSLELMKWRADFYNQIRNLPDGTKIKFKVK